MRCPNCGSINPDRKKFCGDCGTALISNGPATQASYPSTADIQVTADPPGVSITAEGERKNVTALFADIKGSTELLESLDPEEARAVVDPALRIMVEAVRRYDGYVVQTTGDGIFALFGAPAAYEDHPQRGLYAALKMQQDMSEYSRRLLDQGLTGIETRVGVNTGEVVVRTLETGDRVEYTPIGYTANLASRLQTLAPPGSVITSDQSRRLSEGNFVFRPLGVQPIKGVREPIELFEVVGLGKLRTHFELSEQRGLTKFVGRAREMAELQAALESATRGNGCVVALVAEAGSGKSRLIHEFKAAISPEWKVLQAYSVSHGKASTYMPVIELLKNYFNFKETDDEDLRRANVRRSILALDRSLTAAITYLLALLGLDNGEAPLAQMDAQLRRRRILEAVAQLFLSEARRQPLIAVFEDLHWIDDETQALLNLLVERSKNASFMLLVSYRPEYRHDWGNQAHYQELRVEPLDVLSAEEMIGSILSPMPAALAATPVANSPRADNEEDGLIGNSPPDCADSLSTVSQLIIERTAGNPLFIEEMVRALFEHGLLKRDGAVHLIRPVSQIKIPTTVQAILAGRVDGLAAAEKDLLQRLAVVGNDFPITLARRVTTLTESKLRELLSTLENAGFIRRQGEGEPIEYSFKHALTQEVAYGSVLAAQRSQLHELIGGAIEAEFADRLSDHLTELAHHYGRSGNRSKAIEYLYRAGLQAEQRSAYTEAVDYQNKALELLKFLPDDSARIRRELPVQIALGSSLKATKGFAADEIGRAYTRARDLCTLAGEQAPPFGVLYGEFLFHYWKTDPPTALKVARELMREAERDGDPGKFLTAQFALGIDLAHLDELVPAREHLEKAISIFDPEQRLPLELELQRVVSCGYLGLTLIALGYPDRGRSRVREARATAIRSNDPFILANALCVAPLAEMYCGNGFRMQSQAQALAALAEKNGFAALLPLAAGYRAAALILEGYYEQGIDELRRSIAAAKVAGSNPFGGALRILGYGLGKAGRVREGLQVVDEALGSSTQAGARRASPHLYHVKGILLAHLPSGARQAKTSLRTAIRLARQQSAKLAELRATISLAKLVAKEGNRRKARNMLAEIYNWFTEGFDIADLKDAQALVEELSR